MNFFFYFGQVFNIFFIQSYDRDSPNTQHSQVMEISAQYIADKVQLSLFFKYAYIFQMSSGQLRESFSPTFSGL